jgi:hypothetical protein
MVDRNYTEAGVVSLRANPAEPKGWATFRAAALNRSASWNCQIPKVLTQTMIEEWSQRAIREGFDRNFTLDLNKDDLDAYNDNWLVRVRLVVNEDGTTTIGEVETKSRPVV